MITNLIILAIGMIAGAVVFYGGYLTGWRTCVKHFNVASLTRVDYDTPEPRRVKPGLPDVDKVAFNRMIHDINSMDDSQTYSRELREQTVKRNVHP